MCFSGEKEAACQSYKRMFEIDSKKMCNSLILIINDVPEFGGKCLIEIIKLGSCSINELQACLCGPPRLNKIRLYQE